MNADEARADAKVLLRTTREATLATLDRATGAPFATLVGLATDHGGAPVLLLSSLSSHTKNIEADARASLLIASARKRGDPLNRPRLTLVGELKKRPDASTKARYLARNPKAKLYAGFADFALFRLETTTIHFNGGFARAAPLTAAELFTDLVGAEALLGDEPLLLRELAAGDAASFNRLTGSVKPWRALGLDPEGLDLAAGAHTARISFSQPAKTPAEWRAAFNAMIS
jgi:heme iron utilization protein